MEQFFMSLGAPMVGYVLLYFVLQKTFEQQKQRVEESNISLNKLMDKLDKLSDHINELVVSSAQKNISVQSTADDIKDMYVRIATKQEAIKKTVEAVDIRTQLCPKQQEAIKNEKTN